jgi:hypothetical protein
MLYKIVVLEGNQARVSPEEYLKFLGKFLKY